MESFALTLFVLCACTGLLTVGVLARWLRSQAEASPDIELASVPPSAMPTQQQGAAQATRQLSLDGDDVTQPMTRTQTNWANSTDWPSTLAVDPGMETIPPTEPYYPEFADTQPMPVETVGGR